MRMPPTQVDFVEFKGGLDLVTPPLSLTSGKLRECENYEIGSYGGYKRTAGYERFDGHPSPAAATYTTLPVTLTGTIAAGDTITGATSGATGVYIGGPSGYLYFTKATGTFVSGENIQVSAVTQAVSTGVPTLNGAANASLDATYTYFASTYYAADITAVPGSGQIRGMHHFGGVMYAFRNNAGNTATDIYKSSAAGWVNVAPGEEVNFTNADTGVGQDEVLTQGGVTATIKRIAIQTGTLASGVNTGRFIISGRAGGSFAAGAATTPGGTVTLASVGGFVGRQITLTKDGRYRFVNYNFGSGLRMYGCDGVNRGFEFDGTIFVPIATGMASDTPDFVAAHKNHLFFAFDNSLQHSSLGVPYTFAPISGAGELNLGDTTTNLLPQPSDSIAGGAMACFTRNKTYLLYGSSSNDWNLASVQHDSGALAHTAQNIGGTYVLDDRGITSLATTQNFGNFASAAVSDVIRPYITANKTTVKDSCISREKNQYRLLFGSGRALYMTLVGNKIAGFMPQQFADNMILCESVELSDGSEAIFYADDAGFIYQAEKGTSFDGSVYASYMTLVFNHSKSPRTQKQYRKAAFEVGGEGYSLFSFTADLGYGSAEIPALDYEVVTPTLSDDTWDTGTWDTGVWDGQVLEPSESDLTGTAQNISLRIFQNNNIISPLTFYGVLIHYTPRRLLR